MFRQPAFCAVRTMKGKEKIKGKSEKLHSCVISEGNRKFWSKAVTLKTKMCIQ